MKIRTAHVLGCLMCSWGAIGAQTLPEDFVVQNAVSGGKFQVPVGIAFAPNGKLFVAEKRGRVYLVDDGVKQTAPFIDLELEVLNIGDLGLLGIAVDPNFESNGFVYLLYVVDPNQDGVDDEVGSFGRITRYRAQTSNPNVANLASRRVLLGETWEQGIPVCHLSHSVGSLRFGSDGTLLVSTGDGASYEGKDVGGKTPDCFGSGKIDPTEDIGRFRSQTIKSLSGKILRIDPATGLGLPSNPYFNGNPADTESKIWAYGLRNAFRFGVRANGSADPTVGRPGTLVVGDVGEGKYEDVEAVSEGGENFGWPCFQGLQVTGFNERSKCSTGTERNPAPKSPPLMSFHHEQGNLSQPHDILAESIIGGAFYNGRSYPPEYRGGYFFGDFVNGWVKVLQLSENDEFDQLLDFTTIQDQSLVDFQADPISGDIHYVNIREGKVFRFRYTGAAEDANQSPIAIATAEPDWGLAPLTVHFRGGDSFDPDSDELSFRWSFGDGGGSNEANPSHIYEQNGTFEVELTVTDADGAQARFFLEVTVGSTPPLARIIKPDNGSTVNPNELIFFEGIAEDAEDSESDLVYKWEVLLHHNDHTHPEFFNTSGRSATFAAGEHGDPDDFVYVEAELQVSDSQGLTDTAHVFVVFRGEGELDITDEGTPISLITSPTGPGSRNLSVISDNSWPPVGGSDPLRQYDTFTGGGARDLDWIGYEFSTEHRFSKLILQEGIHYENGGWFETLKAQVRHDGIWEDVTNFNTVVPYAGNNDVNYEAYTLLFGPRKGDAIRVCGKPGGTDQFISVAELRVIKTPIEEMPAQHLEFHPMDDAFVWSKKPTANYGSQPDLRVRSTTEDQVAYLKFDVKGISADVRKATLQLYMQDGSDDGGELYSVSNSFANAALPWTERELIWTNAPQVIGSPVATIGAAATGAPIEVDVTSLVQGDGIYSFALKNASSDVAILSSKEGLNPPHLLLDLEAGHTNTHTPLISAIVPNRGEPGSQIEIRGSHLEETVKVTFSGVAADDFSAQANRVNVTVPAKASSGKIIVTTLDGVAESLQEFTVASPFMPPPVILGFSPLSGSPGTSVTIVGLHLAATTGVTFGGHTASVFSVASDSLLTADVPVAAQTGKIGISTPTGTTASAQAFKVLAGEIEILSFLPSDDASVWSRDPDSNRGGEADLRVRKSGEKQNVYLKFNLTEVVSPVVRGALLLFVRQGGTDGGKIFQVSNYQSDGISHWDELRLNWNNAPPFNVPSLAEAGAVETGDVVEFDVTKAISGNGDVSFAIKNRSSELIRYDSREGDNPPVLVITMQSTQPSARPAILSFHPLRGPADTEVEIRGRNLRTTHKISFGEKIADTFSVASDSLILARAPFGATTGRIRLITAAGQAESFSNFVVEPRPVPPPLITEFAPSTGKIGTEVNIYGSNFGRTYAVRFGHEQSVEYSVDSDILILAVVPRDANSGKITVTTEGGSTVTESDFLVLNEYGGSTFTFLATDDAFVRSSKPLNNYGNWPELRVRQSSSAQHVAYFRFEVAGLSGFAMEAKLRLKAMEAASQAGVAFVVSNNYDRTSVPWDEVGLNWQNAPRIDGAALSSMGAAGADEIVEFDVTSAVSKDGVYSFAVKQNSQDLIKFSSKEGVWVPQLIVKTGSHLGSAADLEVGPARNVMLARRAPLPEQFSLGPNYPNPFNLETNIQYGLPSPAAVRLSICNLRGQEVRRLVDAPQSPGLKLVRWDGKNTDGQIVASGIYIVWMRAGDWTFADKVILQK